MLRRKRIVLLGMMTKIPVAGAVWGTLHYLIGFQRLGYDVYYVEAHARTPSSFMEDEKDDGAGKAAAFIDRTLQPFGLGDHWAYHALHDDGRCYGLSDTQLKELYHSADLIINHHGGTVPLSEHTETGRLIYLETDPVELEVELYHGQLGAIDFVKAHKAFFTWGLNYGHPDCRVPIPEYLKFHVSPPPVVPDLWMPPGNRAYDSFTTVGNWKQPWREVRFRGEVYHWSKHYEFLKFIDLPRRTPQTFELALSSYRKADQDLLEGNGWRVRHALDFSMNLGHYRDYIMGSRGEFTVAKDQNIRLRSGWFSERSAQYLAAGKPVITQETGFSNFLPSGEGLFAFSTLEEILGAIDRINSDYEAQSRAALEIACEYLSYDRVLPRLLAQAGL
jgi:hypothetical protein